MKLHAELDNSAAAEPLFPGLVSGEAQRGLQAEATELRKPGSRAHAFQPSEDTGAPVAGGDGLLSPALRVPLKQPESAIEMGKAIGAYDKAVKAARDKHDPEPYATAMGKTQPLFESAINQSEREYGYALLRATMKLGLKDSKQVLDAVKEFNDSQTNLGNFSSVIDKDNINDVFDDVRAHMSIIDRDSPMAKAIEQRLPEGLLDAAYRFKNAVDDPKVSEYLLRVKPTVVNRMQLLEAYASRLGAAGKMEESAERRRQWDDLLQNY